VVLGQHPAKQAAHSEARRCNHVKAYQATTTIAESISNESIAATEFSGMYNEHINKQQTTKGQMTWVTEQ
jgi:hypothetical protein